MAAVAVIIQDRELERLLTHLGQPKDFPRMQPARAPPMPDCGEDSQIDPAADAWDGRDDPFDSFDFAQDGSAQDRQPATDWI